MSDFNEIHIAVYDINNNRLIDPNRELEQAGGIEFATQYPGGLYSAGSFYLPREVLLPLYLNGGYRVVFSNYDTVVFEGQIANLQPMVSADSQGLSVKLLGPWGYKLMRRGVRKTWADNRISEDVWQPLTGNQEDKFIVDRSSRIQYTPKGVAFIDGDVIGLRYYMPSGQTIKRVVFDYNLTTSSVAPNWEMRLYDPIGASVLWSVSRSTAGTTSGNADTTLATPRNYLNIAMRSTASQTPVEDGSVYAKFTDITVYSETGSINMEEIAKDITALVTGLSTNTYYVTAAGTPLSLIPYGTDAFRSYAEILDDITRRGDGAYNHWAASLLHSGWSNAGDGKPLLKLEQYPSTSDYEYVIRLDDDNLDQPYSWSVDYDSLGNWVIVEYTDANGKTQYQTPDDDANLKDQTSIDKFDRADLPISIGQATSTMAIAIGRRLLAEHKDPKVRLLTPITVREYIWEKGYRRRIPASEITAGKRIHIADYPDEVLSDQLSQNSFNFVINQTAYNDDAKTCQMTSGTPPGLILPQFSFPAQQAPAGNPVVVPIAPPVTQGIEPMAADNRPNRWEIYAKVMGISPEEAHAIWPTLPLAERNRIVRTKFREWRRNREKKKKRG